MCSIETSPAINAIGAALLAFQKATHGVVKDSRNPHFKNRYASLEAVIEAAKPGLQENGLAFLQAPGRVVNGTLEVSTMLMHPESGEWIRSTMSTPLQKQDPQGVGSALTYCCRYALMASLGLPALDDDAEATRHQPEQRRDPEPPGREGGALNDSRNPNPVAAIQGSAANSRAIYVQNSKRHARTFSSAQKLTEWFAAERKLVWPDFGLTENDPDGQAIIEECRFQKKVLVERSAA